MKYGYSRCSTNESTQDINRQLMELNKAGVIKENVFYEYESGTKIDRIQLNRLLNAVVPGDTIVTTEISRLTRSTKQLCDIIKIIEEKRLKLIIVGSIIIDCTNGSIDPMTNAFLQITGVFAELEKNIISQRVKSGMANAREKGSSIGRPTTSINNLPEKFIRHYPKCVANQINKEDLARLCGVSRQSIYKYIKIYKESLV